MNASILGESHAVKSAISLADVETYPVDGVPCQGGVEILQVDGVPCQGGVGKFLVDVIPCQGGVGQLQTDVVAYQAVGNDMAYVDVPYY